MIQVITDTTDTVSRKNINKIYFFYDSIENNWRHIAKLEHRTG